jgi:hypothetical protein
MCGARAHNSSGTRIVNGNPYTGSYRATGTVYNSYTRMTIYRSAYSFRLLRDYLSGGQGLLAAGQDAIDVEQDHFTNSLFGEVGNAGIVEGISKSPGRVETLAEPALGRGTAKRP